jgi:3-hydroxy-3-methylglutaryl CoA synthase
LRHAKRTNDESGVALSRTSGAAAASMLIGDNELIPR